MKLVWLAVLAACQPVQADPPTGGEAVLSAYCTKCHGQKAEGDFAFAGDTTRLVAEGYIVPGDSAASPVYRRVADGEMPPAGVKRRPTQAEIAALRTWIDGMAVANASTFRRDRDLARALAADAARLGRDDRTFARYFTLSHLANAGVPGPQLDRYRVALAVLLASLTWSATAPQLVAIDSERLIFRVDLRELGWTLAQWDTLRASYPYGVARGPQVPDAVRADWFVATASRPPLYGQLLALPATEAELGQRLGIDIADDIARLRVARAGFNRSGVSINNRVIERHATRHGALWRSYDFASSTGSANIFEHPLAFVPAGGELIFNLPDGFQGYMLVDGNGRIIPKAPTAIVSDPRRPDRAVETGVSCMGCHASGIVAHADQLRALAPTLERDDRIRLLALHPKADALAALYAADRKRFAEAYDAIHAKPVAETADEPITLLVARYEGELDLALAAAELGLRAEELRTRAGRAEGALAALVAGGTIKRDTWAAEFPRLVDELGVGVAFTPRSSADVAPPVWIDRDRATWLLAGAADHATARERCRARGFELPHAHELAAALHAGLATALQPTDALWTAAVKLDAQNLRYATVVDLATGTARRADVLDRHAVACLKR